MYYSVSLADYINEWMHTFKSYTVKQSTYGDGFEEMYEALVGK